MVVWIPAFARRSPTRRPTGPAPTLEMVNYDDSDPSASRLVRKRTYNDDGWLGMHS